MGLDLSKMRAKAEEQIRAKEKKSSENDAYFWKPPVPSGDEKQTKTKVRMILPPDGDPLRMLWFHYGLRGTGGVLCLKRNYEEKCPICDFATKLWKSGDKEEAKKLFAKERYFAPIVVRDQLDKGVRWINLNFTNHNKILYDYILDKDFQENVTEDITDPQTGVDLVIKRERPQNGKAWDNITVDVSPAGKSPLASPKEVIKIVATLKPLDEIMKRKSLKEVEELLEMHITGSVEREVKSEDDDSDQDNNGPGLSLERMAAEIEAA